MSSPKRAKYNDIRSAGKLPVIVVAGSRDAGKTTLLNYILQEQKDKKLAVIENVKGKDSLQDVLVEQERYVLATGCIRCTIRQDLVASLKVIAEKVKSGLQIDGVLIELSGLQYPGPVMQTFFVNPEIEASFFVDNLVALVDATHAMQQLDESTGNFTEKGTACAEVAYAGTVILNKIDLVEERELAKIECRIKELNPTSDVIRCQNTTVPVANLFDVHAFDFSKVMNQVALFDSVDGSRAWMKPKMDESSIVCIRCPGLINMYLFQRFLDNYIGDPELAMDFIRIKAVLNIAGSHQKFVVQCIHMLRIQSFMENYASDEAHENKIIFFGLGMKVRSQELTDAFKACLVQKPLRFNIGATVQAKIGEGDGDYAPGHVVQHWDECHAYGIRLFSGEEWQAPHDVDRFVRTQ